MCVCVCVCVCVCMKTAARAAAPCCSLVRRPSRVVASLIEGLYHTDHKVVVHNSLQ